MTLFVRCDACPAEQPNRHAARTAGWRTRSDQGDYCPACWLLHHQARTGLAHGTRSSYSHGCRCEPCTEANASYMWQRRAVRRRNPPPAWVNHNYATYRNWGCRCPVCRADNSWITRQQRITRQQKLTRRQESP